MNFDYELIDCGNFKRFERFGNFVIERPCAQADFDLRWPPVKTDIRFDKKKGWQGTANLPENWIIEVLDRKAELRFSQNGQVGIFPEQLANWQWISDYTMNVDRPLNILNTFAYTGMSSLMGSRAEHKVCHVDGAKASLNWAKQNALKSGLDEKAVRWICDDVMTFMAREVRRGNKYDAIILDPPAFGRGAKSDWRIYRDMEPLLELVDQLLSEQPAFVILTCHAPDHFSQYDLAYALETLEAFDGKKAEPIDLVIPSEKGNSLPSSFGARISA